MMYMYYNGLLNRFWAKHNDMRPGPMASLGLGPSFRREGQAYGPCYKAGVPGLRPKWAWGAPCRTTSYIYIYIYICIYRYSYIFSHKFHAKNITLTSFMPKNIVVSNTLYIEIKQKTLVIMV